MALFGMLAVWMHRKDSALTANERSRRADFFGKGMVWAGCSAVGWVVVAVDGMLDSTFGLPHWSGPPARLLEPEGHSRSAG
jgi:hypothetical protein